MKYKSSKEQGERESGTRKDVKDVDGRAEHMRHSHHEMGEYKDGKHHHDHHRGKAD